MYEFNVEEQTNKCIEWIRNWFDKNGKDSNMIIGISGGKDSSVCAALGVKALGVDRVIGILMPNGEQKDISDSIKLCDHLGIKAYAINIGDMYKSLTDKLRNTANNTIGESYPNSLYSTNTPARLRMVTLYGVAALNNGRVVNTCNISESIIGWETFGGDGFGDFSPIGKLTTEEVVAIGDYLGLPYELTHKIPNDGMCGSSDEEKIGFTYHEVNELIRNNIHGEHYNKIIQMNKSSHFKHDIIHIPTFEPNLNVNKEFNW